MAVALQILASGFAVGAVYGLVAVGHSIVFRLTGVVHFAFGELIALGVFVTLLVAAGSGQVSQTSVGGTRFLLALLVGLVVTAAASAGSYFLAIEPYRSRGSVIGWVGASLAVAFAIRTLLVVFYRPAYATGNAVPRQRDPTPRGARPGRLLLHDRGARARRWGRSGLGSGAWVARRPSSRGRPPCRCRRHSVAAPSCATRSSRRSSSHAGASTSSGSATLTRQV